MVLPARAQRITYGSVRYVSPSMSVVEPARAFPGPDPRRTPTGSWAVRVARPCLQTADVSGLNFHLSAMRRGDLTDEQWQRLEPLLPPEKPGTGRPNEDHRQILNGILWIHRTGAPWRDLPRRYGPVGTVSSRFYRWRKAGIWQRILSDLQAEAQQRGEIDWELHFVDATIVRAHQHAAGARRDGATPGGPGARGSGTQPRRVLDQAAPARRGQRAADHGGADRRRAQ